MRKEAWLALGIVGAAVLVIFDTPATIIIGVLLLLAFIAIGVWLIATPDFLRGDREP